MAYSIGISCSFFYLNMAPTRHKCLAHIQLLYMQNEITGDNTAWNLQGSSALCFIYLYVIKYLITHSVLTAKV